jgi:hypothetical protein
MKGDTKDRVDDNKSSLIVNSIPLSEMPETDLVVVQEHIIHHHLGSGIVREKLWHNRDRNDRRRIVSDAS